jgi:hypothetical protein
MSHMGQKQTSRPEISMSALPPKADMVQHDHDVRFVPKADVKTGSRQIDKLECDAGVFFDT